MFRCSVCGKLHKTLVDEACCCLEVSEYRYDEKITEEVVIFAG